MVCLARGYSIVGALAVALAGGCGAGDLAGAADAGDTDEATGNGGGSSDGPSGDEDDDGESSDTDDSGALGSTGGAPTGTGADSTGGDSDSEPESACDLLDCSGGGFCEDVGDGPTCVCEEGWASVGLDCLRCDVIDGSALPATVPAVPTAFQFLIGGASPPQTPYENSRLWLRNRASGDSVYLGATRDQDAALLVVPGIYDVLYVHAQGSDLPLNRASVLEHIEISDRHADFVIDVPTVPLQGSIAFDAGAEPDNEFYNYGRLWLVDATTGDRVPLGNTRDGEFRINVIPGEYEVRYEMRQSQGDVPLNRDGTLETIVVDSDNTTHNVVVPVSHVFGTMTFDGETQDSVYDNGDLELIDVATGDRFPLAETEDTDFDIVLLPGTYEVVYTSRQPGERTPINKGTVVDLFEVGKNDDLEHSIDIRTVVVDGSFTLGGSAPPTDAFDDGLVRLEGSSGELITLGNTADGAFSQRVVAGEYGLVYAQETAGISMPVNTAAHLETVDLTNSQTLDIDIPVVEVVGNLTIGGDAAPDSPYDDGRLFLQNAETGDTVLLGNTREGNYAARIVPGTYDVIYKNEFSEVYLPVNQGAVVMQGVSIDAGAVLDIDVPVSTLEGAVQIQGSNPSVDEGIGNLFLRDVGSGDEVFIGHTGATNFSKPLTDGTYLMEYRGVAAEGATLGESLPANEKAAFACFEVVSE